MTISFYIYCLTIGVSLIAAIVCSIINSGILFIFGKPK